MWSKFAPVVAALAVGLQGCAFLQLPPEVQIAAAKACGVAVGKLSDDEGLETFAAGQHGCGGADAQKLKDLGVEDCPTAAHGMLSAVFETECESNAGEGVEQECQEVSSGCKSKLDGALQAWVPTALPEDDAAAEKQEGFEATIAIVSACAEASKTFVDGEQEAISQVCSEATSAENLKTMGVTAEDCPEYINRMLNKMHTVVCATTIALPIEDPDTVDKKFIDDAVKGYVDSLETDSADNLDSQLSGAGGDRLRLFQAALKSKKWLGRKSSLSKIAVFGGATLIALAVLVAVGIRRLKREPAAEEQEMLEDIE